MFSSFVPFTDNDIDLLKKVQVNKNTLIGKSWSSSFCYDVMTTTEAYKNELRLAESTYLLQFDSQKFLCNDIIMWSEFHIIRQPRKDDNIPSHYIQKYKSKQKSKRMGCFLQLEIFVSKKKHKHKKLLIMTK